MIKAASKAKTSAIKTSAVKTSGASASKNSDRDVCQVRCVNQALVTQVSEALPEDEILANAQILFNALADKSRLKILHALSEGQELCVCDVASLLEVKVAAASHHLRKLRDLKILRHRSDGKLAYYSLADQRIASILSHALQQLAQ